MNKLSTYQLRKRFIKAILLQVLFLLAIGNIVFSQAILEADGPGNTYELINSILAPGYTSVEAPDQCTSHPSFGRHVAEVFDATLNQHVFEFYIHVPTVFPVTATSADNDRCLNFDRQRIEIKTYESSPDSLKGTVGETITYKWKFRLPVGFQPSPNFTHIHQIKAVGGDDDDPIFTLTARYGSSNNSLQLLFVDASANSAVTLQSANLNSFLGQWVEVTEQIKAGTTGTYSIVIKKVSDGSVLLNYSDNSILTIRADNNFIRPKWGIYRSLNSPSYLRDDSIRIAGIQIFEGLAPTAPNNLFANTFSSAQINLTWNDNATNETSFEIERSLTGVSNWATVGNAARNATVFYNTALLANTTYYYRIRAVNPAGLSSYSNVVSAKTQTALASSIVDFYAKQNNQSILLYWKTVDEKNIARYNVEYSEDGIAFKTLGAATALNNIGVNLYSFTHLHFNATQCYYRLKVLEIDGRSWYSTTVFFQWNKENSIHVFPNPAKDFLWITATEKFVVGDKFIVKDVLGRIIKQGDVVGNNFPLNISEFLEGVYAIQFFRNSKMIYTDKLIVKR